MAVSQMELHGATPSAVWTVKKRAGDEFDAYMVLSFQNATLVLAIQETVVEEFSDSGVLDTAPSLAVGLLGEDSLMQVHPKGVRQIRRIKEWSTSKTIVAVGFNPMQVVVALRGGELVYFQMDMMANQLIETAKREMASEVACLDIAPLPDGRQRSGFVAVGSHDSTIRLLSLNPDDCMHLLSVLAVSSPPASLLLEDGDHGVFLNAGLQNGVLLRSEVDMVTGELSETRADQCPVLRTASAQAIFCSSEWGQESDPVSFQQALDWVYAPGSVRI
jgi:splicing factor 3B subunit 3